MQEFKHLGLDAFIVEALTKKGYVHATPIQEKVIPILLNHSKDIVGQAQTGTGKTAAFSLPIIQNVSLDNSNVQAIILAPTRELALQVSREIESFSINSKLKTLTVYGGQSIDNQIKKLKKGVQVVVGTPGRVIDLIERKKLHLNHLKYFVLDEADEMLNMGFIDDIELILKQTNESKQILLFSATMPKKILVLAKKYMKDYELIKVKSEQVTASNTEQLYYNVSDREKMNLLERIIQSNPSFYGIVFCNTRAKTDKVSKELNKLGYASEALHGDIQQNQRERILERFKSNVTNILCATDVAARGIDVNELTHVINYQLPQDPESYIHRIGRTGRAGNKGVAISFISMQDKNQQRVIEAVSKTKIKAAELPSINTVFETKIDNTVSAIEHIELSDEDQNIYKVANALTFSLDDSFQALAKTIKYFLKSELDPKQFKEVKLLSPNSKQNKETRLFIAKGKKDGMNAKDIEDFVCIPAEVSPKDITDTYVLNEFSFISLPEEEASKILHYFKSKKKKGKSLVTKAKNRDQDKSRKNRFEKSFSNGLKHKDRSKKSKKRKRFKTAKY